MGILETDMRFTRGAGRLEHFLARQRVRVAEKNIGPQHRLGRILDVGCGNIPFFLMNVEFREKDGIDKLAKGLVPGEAAGIALRNFDMESEDRFPYPDCSFDVVTMLAVIEHIAPPKLPGVLHEVHRMLKPGGAFIVTTPACWTDPLLKILAKTGMVSREEIEEHKDVYDHRKVRKLLVGAGFNGENIRCGYFEIFMNLWFSAAKTMSER